MRQIVFSSFGFNSKIFGILSQTVLCSIPLYALIPLYIWKNPKQLKKLFNKNAHLEYATSKKTFLKDIHKKVKENSFKTSESYYL